MSSDLSNLWQDLRRRRVFQVAAIYAAGAWVLVQVIDVIGPTIFGGNVDRVMAWLVAVAVVGFPIAVILAWLFDLDKNGVHRTKPGSATGIFAIIVSVGLLGAGTAGFVWLIKPGVEAEQVALDFEPIKNSVAVMPFADLSPEKGFQHFTDGIAAVLIHKLSPVAELTVFASDSTFQFRGQDPKTIRQKLGAERLLSGTVQRFGGQFRISTWLVDTRTGKTVWSEQFDRPERDIFAIQDEIALAVAGEMGAAVEPTVRDRIMTPITDDLDAYDLYLLATHEIRNTPLDDGNAKGIALLEQALEKDPEFALGWASLASVVFWHGARGHMSPDEAMEKSAEYRQRALEIDPQLSEAHSQIATRAGMRGDLNTARESFEKAIKYGPSNAGAYIGFGMALRRQGRFTEALGVLERGLELDPYNPAQWLLFNLGAAHLGLGQYETAMQYLATSYTRTKGSLLAEQSLQWLGGSALDAGRYDESIAAYEIALRDGHESLRTRAVLAQALLVIGDFEAAAEEIARAETLVAQQRADGQHMNYAFWQVEYARFLLDIATRNIENQLRVAKHYTKLADESDDNIWDFTYEAGFTNLMLGRHEDAARMINLLIERGAHDPENYAFAAYAYGKAGNVEKSKYFLEEGQNVVVEMTTEREPETIVMLWVALFQSVDGKIDESIANLQRAYDERGYRDHLYLTYMPIFDPLRNDPRFIALLRSMRADTDQMRKRVDAARKTGDWESLIARHFEPASRPAAVTASN